MREMSGFKDVVEPSVETVVEGFKVVSAVVIDDVTDAMVAARLLSNALRD